MKGCDAAVVRSLERDLRASLLAWGMPEPCITTIVPLAEQIDEPARFNESPLNESRPAAALRGSRSVVQ
jgi:hypothetical protein